MILQLIYCDFERVHWCTLLLCLIAPPLNHRCRTNFRAPIPFVCDRGLDLRHRISYVPVLHSVHLDWDQNCLPTDLTWEICSTHHNCYPAIILLRASNSCSPLGKLYGSAPQASVGRAI